MSLREVADATKISLRFLQAIEQERFEVLPGGIFRRAFVRQYARHLGLDAERLVAEFDYFHSEDTPAEPGPVEPRKPLPWRALLVIGLGLGVGAAWWVGARRSPRPEAAAQVAVSPPATLAAGRVYPPPTPTPTPEPESLVLTLVAQQSCWVGVNADGETVLNRVMNRGETETVEARNELILSAGNAGGLSFAVNGLPGASLGRSGEVRKNVVINFKNLPLLVDVEPAPDSEGN